MSFNSLFYLIFLPLVVLVYWKLPHRMQWGWLLAASLFFYMSWNVSLIGLILITIGVTYGSALRMEKAKNRTEKKIFMILTVTVCLGILFVFKYLQFFTDNLVLAAGLFGVQMDSVTWNLILPIGISFYTFQTLSYVIDVYRGTFPAEHHLGYYALYVSSFPQLVAGPIEKPGKLLVQLRQEKSFRESDFQEGVLWLLSGFFRKCVAADFLGQFVDNVYGNLDRANGLSVLIATGLFFLQIYNDFAGYSEIAMGSARLLGIQLSVNFRRPLTAVSFTDFFRRWHITLNRWFTEYVYIPLGGNRRGIRRKLTNTMLVFLLCGLWHGASWTYVLWGVNAGFFVCLETVLAQPLEQWMTSHGIRGQSPFFLKFRRIAVMLLFLYSCVLFRAPSMKEAAMVYRQSLFGWELSVDFLRETGAVLGISWMAGAEILIVIWAMISLERFMEGITTSKISIRSQTVPFILLFGILAIGLFWLGVVSNIGTSAFAYFQF